MQLTDLLQYDLTGERTEFKKLDAKFSIYSAKQVIYLEEPAYANSIKIYLVSSYASNPATGTLWAKGTNYEYDGTYASLCTDAESESLARVLFNRWPYKLTTDTKVKANKNYYLWNNNSQEFYKDTTLVVNEPIPANTYFEPMSGNWNAKLVNKIQILTSGTTSNPKKIIVQYQKFKQSAGQFIGDSEGPMYSPGLMRTVIEQLNELHLERMSDIVNDNEVAFSSSLKIDLTGLNSENFIKNEKHIVDTTSDKFVIRPITGSFYKYSGDDLKVVFVSVDNSVTKTLVQESGDGTGDYEVIGVNYTKTAMSEPTGGVYEFIALKKAFVGSVYIDYHAFGGEVSMLDITNLQNELISLRLKLKNDQLLTAANIKNSIVVANILDRLDFLEHQLEHYRSQSFLYRTNTDDKWVNIAYINCNPWMEGAPMPDNEVGKFQFEIQHFTTNASLTAPTRTLPDRRSSFDLEFKFSYEAIRDIITENGTTKNIVTGIRIRDKEVHMTNPTFEEVGCAYFNQRLTPKFRVIGFAKNSAGVVDFNNGLMVQMSITSTISDYLAIRVSDKTAAKSPWTLVDSLNNERTDQSLQTTFNNCIWTLGEGKASNVIPVYGTGYSIFRGSIDVAAFNTEYSNPSALNGDEATPLPTNVSQSGMHIVAAALKSELLLYAIKGLRVQIYDRHRGSVISAETSQVAKIEYDDELGLISVSGSIVYYLEDMCGMTVEVRILPESTRGSICLFGYCGSNSLENNRFALIGIDIF